MTPGRTTTAEARGPRVLMLGNVIAQERSGVGRWAACMLPRLARELAARGGELALAAPQSTPLALPREARHVVLDLPSGPPLLRWRREGPLVAEVLQEARAAGRPFDWLRQPSPLRPAVAAPRAAGARAHELARARPAPTARRDRRSTAAHRRPHALPRGRAARRPRLHGQRSRRARTNSRALREGPRATARSSSCPTARTICRCSRASNRRSTASCSASGTSNAARTRRSCSTRSHSTPSCRTSSGSGAAPNASGSAALARELGIERRVTFIDGADDEDLARLLARAAVCVLPSLLEGFGLVAVVEALRAGTPLVHARAGALPEVAGGHGHAFDPKDPRDLVRAIDAACEAGTSTAGVAHAAEFTWDRAARILVDAWASRPPADPHSPYTAHVNSRRRFLRGSLGLAALTLPMPVGRAQSSRVPPFSISLAQWSLHRTLRSGELAHTGFAPFAKSRFGIDAVEYVSTFFERGATDFAYLADVRRAADDAGVKSLLIMIDGEGALGAEDLEERTRAVERHFKWIAAAKFLGCHSIRVNAAGSGDLEEHSARAAESLRRLCLVGDEYSIDVIVENHGGPSSNGAWLARTIARADHPRCGTLPDFGNFHVGGGPDTDADGWYDRYRGVEELMPYARAVSAKSHEFDAAGNETGTDYARMLRIVHAAGYRGHVGIEYEGDRHSEVEGIELTKALLERVRAELAE